MNFTAKPRNCIAIKLSFSLNLFCKRGLLLPHSIIFDKTTLSYHKNLLDILLFTELEKSMLTLHREQDSHQTGRGKVSLRKRVEKQIDQTFSKNLVSLKWLITTVSHIFD